MEASVRPGPRSGLPVLLSFIFPAAMPTPLSLSFPSYIFTPVVSIALLPFHDFSLPARHRCPFLSCIHTRHVATFFSRSHTPLSFLSFSISILDPSPPTIPFIGTDGDSSLSNCFPVPNCYSLGRNGNYPGSHTRETELPRIIR